MSEGANDCAERREEGVCDRALNVVLNYVSFKQSCPHICIFKLGVYRTI